MLDNYIGGLPEAGSGLKDNEAKTPGSDPGRFKSRCVCGAFTGSA